VKADQIEIFKRGRSPSDIVSNSPSDPLFHSPGQLKKVGKRMSITHSKIEGYINEEIREEKSSSSSHHSINEGSPVKQQVNKQAEFVSPKFPDNLNSNNHEIKVDASR
jgi:hypothetical protein